MSSASDDANALTTELVAPNVIEAFLENNPNFLNERPTLLQLLVPPQIDHGSGVVDMQIFMLNRLREDLERMRKREIMLLEAAKANSRVQHRVHLAVDALLEAPSFDELVRVVTIELPGLFDVDKVSLCIETDKPLPAGAKSVGLMVLPPGTIKSFGASEQQVLLLEDTKGNKILFRKGGSKIRSMAHLRLDFATQNNVKNPLPGLLVLGAFKPGAFETNQSTDLLSFFAQVLQRCIQRWLYGAP